MANILITGETAEIDGFMCGLSFVNDSSIVIEDCGDGWVLLDDEDAEEDSTRKLIGGELYYVCDGVEIPE